MGLFGGGKKDTRPVDEGLAQLIGSDENTLIEFWKKRFKMTAAVPDEIARVGALTPQIRELTRVENAEERKRLTRARIIAFAQMSPGEQQMIAVARKKAWSVDPVVLEEDQKLVDQILPTVDANIRAAYPQQDARRA
ncbi:MAG TPA: hypothetical protein VM052_01265 [Candidatus Limnocylindrales bacterium]|nr:hypothetical protein [Candidatus Limnocylindrales bacterium]